MTDETKQSTERVRKELADFSPGSSHLFTCEADLSSENACTENCLNHLYDVACELDRSLHWSRRFGRWTVRRIRDGGES